MKHVLRLGTAAALAMLLGGCSLLLTELATDFSLAVETERVAIAPGATGDVEVRIDQIIPVNVVPVPILVSLYRPPEGVTAEELPIPSGITEDFLTVAIDPSATPGVYEVTIRATNGLKTKEATFELAIVEP